jgi:oligopeptide transport system permease protein
MDTRDKKQEVAAESFMTPDSGMSQAPIEMELTVLTDSDVAITLGENELKDLKEPLKKPPTPFQESMRRLRRDKRAMASVGFIIFFVLLALFGPFIYQHIGGIYNSPVAGPIGPQVYHTFYHQELSRQDELPSFQYWLGTDQLGRDILARLMQGILISITVALLVEVVDVGAGITIGMLAGFNGGAIDQVLARFTDIIFAFPGLLFIILVSGIWGEWADTALSNIPIIGANGNARLLVVSLALAFVAWPLMARYVRGQTLQLKEQQFIEAARTAGTSDFRIMLRHIVPNLFSIVIVAATLNIVGTIVGEAGISLLGLGVQPPGSSLGLMISDAQPQVATHPWEILVPTIVLTIFVLAFSFLGDGLRDAFDPRSKD